MEARSQQSAGLAEVEQPIDRAYRMYHELYDDKPLASAARLRDITKAGQLDELNLAIERM